MASTKELFYKGLCYTYTTVCNLEEDLQETMEAIEYAPVGRFRKNLLQQKDNLKKQIDLQKQIFKNDIEYFGYTETDLKGKFKPYRMSDEELAKDYDLMMNEASGSSELSPELAQAIAGE